MLAAVLLLVPGLQLVGTQALGSQFFGSQTFTQSEGLQLAFLATEENWSNGIVVVVAVALEALVGAGVLLTATLVVAVLAWQEGVAAAVCLAWHWVIAQEGLAAVVWAVSERPPTSRQLRIKQRNMIQEF